MLLMKTGPISYMASVAAETTLASADLLGSRLSILGHAVGGLGGPALGDGARNAQAEGRDTLSHA